MNYDLTLTHSKIAGYICFAFAALEIFVYKNHAQAVEWGMYGMACFGIKNVSSAYQSK